MAPKVAPTRQAISLKGSTELRCVDDVFRTHSDWLFGKVRGKSKWMRLEDVEDEFLLGNWSTDDAEKVGPDGASLMMSYGESLDDTWIATQIWGFQIIDGERRYARNVLVTKGDERAAIRMVYDFAD